MLDELNKLLKNVYMIQKKIEKMNRNNNQKEWVNKQKTGHRMIS